MENYGEGLPVSGRSVPMSGNRVFRACKKYVTTAALHTMLACLCLSLTANAAQATRLEKSGNKKTTNPTEVTKNMDDYERRMSEEYNKYKPVNAARDAEADIASGTIKLFHLDVSEFPEPLVIDDDPKKLPPYTHVSIGGGCIDSLNSDDAAPEYRAAAQNALSYGISYNMVIARYYKLKEKPCPDRLPSSTLDFLDDPPDWNSVQVELHDIQPIFGGRDIWVSGTGMALVRSMRGREEIYRVALEQKDIERLIAAFLKNDFLSLTIPNQTAPPDHGRPGIVLINGSGQQHSLSSWAPPIPGGDREAIRRFQAVYRQLLRLETLARETTKPLHQGEYGDDKTWLKLLKKERNNLPRSTE